ncbi:MAG: hypothetical protein R2787_12885 [Saprospiraceae bacterium]
MVCLPGAAALWMSDLVLNNLVYGHLFESFSWFGSLGTYLGFAGIFILGRLMITPGPSRSDPDNLHPGIRPVLPDQQWDGLGPGIPGISLPLSPEPRWLDDELHSGLPFFGGILRGDLFCNTALFGAWHLAYRQQISWQHLIRSINTGELTGLSRLYARIPPSG